MLSSEFNQAMGSLIRRLEKQVNDDPWIARLVERDPKSVEADVTNALVGVESAIVDLIVLHIKLSRLMA